jgi:hypothetical protein
MKFYSAFAIPVVLKQARIHVLTLVGGKSNDR